MQSLNRPIIHSSIVLVLLLSVSASSQDWAQWRGPNRDGAVVAGSLPTSWPAGVKRVWRVDVGEGYSSPVISANRVYVHSRRDPEEIVTAIDLQSGTILWQQPYAATFAKNQYAVRMAKGPNSTPLLVGARLYTMGVTGILSAWNTADGSLA